MKAFRKLNSRRGASLMLALIVFMLCALAGASAFMMAATNAGRYSHKDEQQYYSVSSAALLMVDMMDGLKYYSRRIDFQYDRTWTYNDPTGSPSDPSNQHTTEDGYKLTLAPTDSESRFSSSYASTLQKSGLNLCNNIKTQCDALVPFLNVPQEWYDGAGVTKDPAPATMTYNFTISVEDQEKFGTVNCKLVMNANYNLLLTFDGGNSEYSMTVYWVADIKEERSKKPPVYEYAVPSEDGQYVKGHMTQVDTVQVTVTWNKKNVTLSRGAAINNGEAGNA